MKFGIAFRTIFNGPDLEVEIPDETPKSARLRVALEIAVRNGANLTGANLTGANLTGANLTGANLYGANFTDANFTDANLYGANLYGANLDGANLYGANLTGANLYGANLYGANLDGANFTDANLYNAHLDGAILSKKHAVPSAARFFQLGPIGSRRAYLLAFFTADAILLKTGCFVGTLDEFKSAVAETHGDNKYGRAYAAAIEFIERMAKA